MECIKSFFFLSVTGCLYSRNCLIQYFFLSAFCWMMCEGVMLYLMLLVVFATLSKKWWFFLLLGWGMAKTPYLQYVPFTCVLCRLKYSLRSFTALCMLSIGYHKVLSKSHHRDSTRFCGYWIGNSSWWVWCQKQPRQLEIVSDTKHLSNLEHAWILVCVKPDYNLSL